MQLPQDYNAGPMSGQEFNDLTSDEQSEAVRLGYVAKIQKIMRNNQIFAKVTFAETRADLANVAADNGPSPILNVAAAAAGAGIGAAIGGPLVAAAGAAAATALTAHVVKNASSSKQAIAHAMQDAADKFDVDPKLLAAIAAVESSFDPTISNPHSTAFGLFQFLDSTWDGVVRQFGAAVGVKTTDRSDVNAQCLMGAAFLRDNQQFLEKRLGREPTDGDCYAAHFLGVATAARLLSGSGEISAQAALGARGPAVVAANPSIFKQGNAIRSVAQVVAELARRVTAAMGRGVQLLETG